MDPGEPELDSSKTDTSCKVGYLTSRRLVLGAQQINENKDMTRNKVPTRYILAAAFFLTLILPIGIGLYTPRDPWIDEAMLTNNFVEMSLGQLRHPMPLYEQAAPIAYIILAKFVLLFSGFVDPIFALRALSAAISLVGILFLVRLAREEASKASAVALAVLLFTSPFFVRYATEIKQYIFDFAATAMIAYGAGGIARSAKTQDFVRFIVWVILGCLLSFVAIVPIVACLSAAALVRILREIRERHTRNLTAADKSRAVAETVRFIVFGGSAVLIAIAFYIVFSRNMTAANLTAYAYFYDKGYIGLGNTFSENLAILARLLSFLIEFWQPYDQILNHIFLGRTPGIAYALQLSVAVVFFSVIAVAFVFCAVRSPFIAISLASTLALIIVLNAAHILPIVVPRYLFFAAPLLYLVLGVGLVEGYHRITSSFSPKIERGIRWFLIASIVIISGTGSVLSGIWKREDISSLLWRIRTDAPGAPVWVYYGAQPAMRLVAPKEIRQTGLFDPTSGVVPWMIRGGGRMASNFDITDPRYPLTIQSALKGERRAWLLFSQAWAELSYEPYLEVAEKTVGPCRLVESTLPKTAAHSRLYFCSAAE